MSSAFSSIVNGVNYVRCAALGRWSSKPNLPLLPPFATAIKIAATQTKSACADWIIKGVVNPDLVLLLKSLTREAFRTWL